METSAHKNRPIIVDGLFQVGLDRCMISVHVYAYLCIGYNMPVDRQRY